MRTIVSFGNPEWKRKTGLGIQGTVPLLRVRPAQSDVAGTQAILASISKVMEFLRG
jgi:hypothetical protein